MPLIIKETKCRTLGRIIGWRIIDFIITICLSFSFGLSVEDSFLLSLIDTIAELIIHYIYERLWLRVKIGMVDEDCSSSFGSSNRSGSSNSSRDNNRGDSTSSDRNYNENNYRNRNGIIMYDKENPENSDCGPLAYEYLYYQAVKDGICKDLFTNNQNNNL